ncbi:DUF3916 domain-containing protein [Bacillus sp. 2205SS5-2]|uniref:DUF3916 domain-containing protein n=1 Tax=Bacillus sp. 2205SS5-2 TaxID=3109031 RepID=UPI003004DF4C
MREKRVRGIKRKSKNLIKRIEENTSEFPTEFHNGYWRLLLPVAQGFINSVKTPKKTKRVCMQTLLAKAEHLIELKPNDREKYRIVATIVLPNLWSSQIIVFKGDSYFNEFFNRNDESQKWLPLSNNRNIQTEWGLTFQKDLQILGFEESITDEDRYCYEGEIWFIGELH